MDVPARGEVVAGRYEVRGHTAALAALVELVAFDRDVEVEVGLWLLRPVLFPTAAHRAETLRAAAKTRSLVHQNLRKLFDAGEWDELVYVTVQRASGDDITRPGQGPPASDGDLLRYARSVAAALEAAHEAGCVHGRLIPDDVVQVAGLIKVGGAGLFGAADPAAASAAWAEQAHYLAPEVRAGREPTPAADVYSMAVQLAELAADTTGPDLAATLRMVAERSGALHDILAAALADAPEARTPSPAELRDAVLLELEREPEAERAGVALDELARAAGDAASTKSFLKPAPEDPDDPDFAAEASDGDPGMTRDLRAPRRAPAHGDEDEDDHTVPEQPPDIETIAELGAPFGAPPPAIPPPTPPSAPAQPPDSAPKSLKFVSMKPASEPGIRKGKTPLVPAIERQRPVLRPIESASPDAPAPAQTGPLQRYAPPRPEAPATAPARPRASRRWLVPAIAVAVAVAAVTTAVVVIFVVDRGGDGDPGEPGDGAVTSVDAGAAVGDPDPPRDAAAGVVVARLDAGAPGCPAEMAAVGDACIDRHEAPGEGRLPSAGIGYAEAEASCRTRGKRLCTGDEWEAGCRGPDGASFPYGSSARRGVCNTRGGRGAEIAPAGSFPGCVSAAGAFDMSGNVAEWVAGGAIRGGSARDGTSGRCSRVTRRRGKERSYSDVGYRCCADLGPKRADK